MNCNAAGLFSCDFHYYNRLSTRNIFVCVCDTGRKKQMFEHICNQQGWMEALSGLGILVLKTLCEECAPPIRKSQNSQ